MCSGIEFHAAGPACAARKTVIFPVYRLVQKTDTHQFYFWDNFGNSAPILTILSLLQEETYGALT